MQKLADYHYALNDQQLLERFRAGDTEAATALVHRYDGIPPVDPLPPDVPLAIVWADLLTGRRDLATTPTST